MTTPNIYKQRLEETLATVKANISNWDQTFWSSMGRYDDNDNLIPHECGSSYCFVGFAVQSVHGEEIPEGVEQEDYLNDVLHMNHEQFAVDYFCLSHDQALDLSASSNTLEDLEEIVGSLHND